MAEFKLTIADPKSGKCYKKEVKDTEAAPFGGLNIGETVKGESFGMTGYEFQITGGSDYCGFPMRRGILGIRKKITLSGGVGFDGKMRPLRKGKKRRNQDGLRRRKTVCGHKINDHVTQINLKVVKEGTKKIADVFGAAKEGAAKEGAEAKAEAKPAEKPKAEVKPEVKAEAKPAEKPKEAPKEEAKK